MDSITGVRLTKGESLIDAIEAAGRAFRGGVEIRASGRIEAVVLEVSPEDEPHTLTGAWTATAMHGAILSGEVVCYATLVRTTDTGIEVVGGRIVSARALDVLLVTIPVAFAGGALTAPRIAATSVSAPSPAPAPAPVPPPPVAKPSTPAASPVAANAPRSLADVARTLEAMPARHEEDDDSLNAVPGVGDLLDHPTFGVVEIVGEDEAGRMKIRAQNGAKREISLDVFDQQPRPPRNGKRVFALVPRRR